MSNRVSLSLNRLNPSPIEGFVRLFGDLQCLHTPSIQLAKLHAAHAHLFLRHGKRLSLYCAPHLLHSLGPPSCSVRHRVRKSDGWLPHALCELVLRDTSTPQISA